MTRAIKSELLKFFTTRMWWGMAIAVFLAGAAFAALFALVAGVNLGNGQTSAGLDDPAVVRGVYTGGIQVGYLLLLSIGVMAIGAEYRHKTITSTFLATPKRGVVMGAKVIALLVIGAFYGIVSMVGSVGVGAAIISAKGHSPFPDSSVLRSVLLGLLVLGLWALIGLGIGILIPNQIAALLIAIGVAWIVEPIIAGIVLPLWEWGKHVAQFLPSSATTQALGAGGGPADPSALAPLSWWAASLVLVAYAAVMAGIGTWLTTRRDIA